jgi:hypothetical protein
MQPKDRKTSLLYAREQSTVNHWNAYAAVLWMRATPPEQRRWYAIAAHY